ncbi:MAG: radical SAM protein [Desulfomonile tiedjei]|uniref:Radical SAM protein n=1 Tax=Desulfomonile tiedjei TaxID=2358 RepID=A0A9D6V480_9BACT|nr:radical SAM protein [Desulfomonile tiedjei]
MDPDTAGHLKGLLESRLRVLDVETTNVCNARCSFCAYRFRKRPSGIMSLDLFSALVDRYVVYGGGDLSLTPLVGDPLVDKDLIRKIRRARSHPSIKEISFATNLIALDRHGAENLLTSGVNWIFVSTSIGNRDMYRTIYGVDKYERVMANLFTLLKTNNELGRPVSISVSLRCSKPYRKVFSSAHYRRAVELLGRYISIIDDDYVNWTGLIREEDLPAGNKFRRVRDRKEPCEQLYHGLQVHVNGDVSLCCCVDIHGDLLVGNVHEDSIEDIWRGNAIRGIRTAWDAGNIPRTCSQCNMYAPLSAFLVLNRDRIAQRN